MLSWFAARCVARVRSAFTHVTDLLGHIRDGKFEGHENKGPLFLGGWLWAAFVVPRQITNDGEGRRQLPSGGVQAAAGPKKAGLFSHGWLWHIWRMWVGLGPLRLGRPHGLGRMGAAAGIKRGQKNRLPVLSYKAIVQKNLWLCGLLNLPICPEILLPRVKKINFKKTA